jgi:hypothetical protein
MPIAQNIKINTLISPLKECNTISHTRVLPLLDCRGWKQVIFKKIDVYARYSVQCYAAHYVIKVLILWSWKRHFSHLYIQINTQDIYNRTLYTIQVQMLCIHPQWNLLHPLSLWSSYHLVRKATTYTANCHGAISIVKPTRCTISQIYFVLELHSTCFEWSFRPTAGVSDCTYSISYMSYRFCGCLLVGTRWNYIQTPDDGWKDCLKHVECCSKTK